MSVLHISQPQPHIKQFYLPSTRTKIVDGEEVERPLEEQDWVKIDVGPETVADWQVINDGDQNYAVRQARIVVRRLVEWSFTDEQGNPAPITFESFWALAPADRLYLLTLKFDQPDGPSLSTQEKKT